MSPASVHWDHEKSLLLISKFKSHEALWNSNNKDFHNTQKKEEGWWAVAEEMKVPVEELRKKIECLRGSYRRERSKVRSSREKEEEYLPKWFAYKSLAFLEETKSQAISDNGHSCDPEDVSVPKIISRPSVQYVFNEGSENSNNESVLSPIKRKFCSTTDQYRPIRAMSESKKQKRFLVNEPMKKDDVNDSSNIADHVETVSMDGAGLPNRMQEDMSERGVVQPSECLRTKKADRSIGIGCLIDKPSKNEKVTSVPVIARATFKPTKPKPAFEKEQPVSKTSNKDDLLETTSKDVAGPYKVEYTGIGSINYNIRRKSKNTTPNPSAPNENNLENDFPKDVNNGRDIFTRNSKPVQSQESEQLDECTAFGQLVESTLRNLSGTYRVEAKMKLSQVLWEVELEALKQNPLSGSYIGLPKPSPT